MAILPYSLRSLYWLADTKETLSGFPAEIKTCFGHGLYLVQIGLTPPIAKPMTGLGAGVFELSEQCDGDAFRVVYALKLGTCVYVIDAFIKKSKTGSKTPKEVIERIRARIKWVREQNG